MGLYFLTPGAGPRPAAVLYDRAGSAFALARADAIDWAHALARRAMAARVGDHVRARRARGGGQPIAPRTAALELGVDVSFDGNYREQLWAASSGDPRAILGGMLATAQIAFVDDRDIALIARHAVHGDGARATPRRGRRGVRGVSAARDDLLARFATSTARQRQQLCGVMFTRKRELVSRTLLARRHRRPRRQPATRSRPGSCTACIAVSTIRRRSSSLPPRPPSSIRSAGTSISSTVRDVEQLVAAKSLDIRR